MRLLLYPFTWLLVTLLGAVAGFVFAVLLVAAFAFKFAKAAFLHFFWPAQRHSLPLLEQWQLRA